MRLQSHDFHSTVVKVPTQRLTLATVVGQSAEAISALFDSWRINEDRPASDALCTALRKNGTALPVIYFCEWIDHWLMGDEVPGPDSVMGRIYQASCLTPEQALAWATRLGNQFLEQQWLAARLREASNVWSSIEPRVVLTLREVLTSTVTDDELKLSLNVIPNWLLSLNAHSSER
jgi:hypothetical protein